MSSDEEERFMSGLNLKVRTFPFNFRKLVEQFSYDDLMRGADREQRLEFLLGLADSLYVEINEQIMIHLKKTHDFLPGQRGDTFIEQERMHSAYHRILNSKMVDDTYLVDPSLGQVNRTAYDAYKVNRQMTISLFEANPNNLVYKKNIMMRTAIFESLVGVILTQNLFEKVSKLTIDEMAEKGPWYYLWLYHGIEESEHCDEVFTSYLAEFGEEPFAEKNMDKCTMMLDMASSFRFNLALNVCKKLGETEISWEEIFNSADFKANQKAIGERFKPGFNPNQLLEERRALIAKWDEEIEPALRAALVKRFNLEQRPNKKSAA